MTTYYIDVGGDDVTGDGSSGNPWETLAHAYDNSIADDILHMNAGTHTFVSDTLYDRTIEGDGATTTILDGLGLAREWSVGGDFIVNDLTLTGSVQSSGAGILKGNTDANVTLNRVIIHSCQVYATGSNMNHGLLRRSGYNTERVDWVLNSCIIYNITKDPVAALGYIFPGHQLDLGDQKGSITMNNCVWHNSDSGMDFSAYVAAKYIPMIYNNCIFYNDSGTTVGFETVGSSGVLNNSCYYDIDDVGTANNCITDDPLFIDPNNRDYRLQQNSPCIDTGKIL